MIDLQFHDNIETGVKISHKKIQGQPFHFQNHSFKA